ncbi:hypothetical protein HFO55_25290 [Rhizobium leguminosarum]|nr:DUF2513 domain-containing protein [Rhizobium leguminosarum]MBY5570525.1 hypothetical protein [Rhizobium leguminosarum]MBY5576998.1 hypothetical protein [Rhizobium leguminosarum]
MKREMDLVRDLLLQIEQFDQGYGGDVESKLGITSRKSLLSTFDCFWKLG